MPKRMSQPEREEFLAALHVGVLSVSSGEDRGPLTVPVWYSYEPGGVLKLTTGGGARKAKAIAAAGRFSLCAQQEEPPYKYVTVEGPAVIEPAGLEDRTEIARRYLGTEQGDAWIAASAGDGQVVIRLTTEHWLASDFSE